jgi:hypothetical protein
MGEKFLEAKHDGNSKYITTDKGTHDYDYLINAAGLDSLEIA